MLKNKKDYKNKQNYHNNHYAILLTAPYCLSKYLIDNGKFEKILYFCR